MLISHSSLLLFVTGAAVLLVIPGPAVTYVVSRSIGHGRAAGLVSVMGIVVGTLFHVVAATFGLSALLASSALAAANRTETVAVICLLGAFAAPALIRDPATTHEAGSLA